MNWSHLFLITTNLWYTGTAIVSISQIENETKWWSNLGKVIQLVNGRDKILPWLSDFKVRAVMYTCLPTRKGQKKNSIDIHWTVMVSTQPFLGDSCNWDRMMAMVFEVSCNGWVGCGQMDMRGKSIHCKQSRRVWTNTQLQYVYRRSKTGQRLGRVKGEGQYDVKLKTHTKLWMWDVSG